MTQSTIPLATLAFLLAVVTMPAFAQEPSQPPASVNPTTTESGLIISILTAGDPEGQKPKLGDTVKVHYKGWLDDGTSFDSSFARNSPAEFRLGQVIEGWNEGLTYVTKGAKLKLEIPSELAYGKPGRPGIPPDSRLTFYIELLDVTPGPPVPDFQKVEGDDVQKHEKGFRYRFEVKGEGAVCKPTDVGVFEFTCWSETGKLVFCQTEKNGGLVKTKPSDFRLPFIAPAVAELKVGSIGWFSVDAGQDWPEGQRPPVLKNGTPSIWRIKLIEIVKMPEFRDLDPTKTLKTASGLEYEVLREGEGENPKATSTVRCHYMGWLTDGTSFDSSYQRGQPASFPLSGVIKGWTEGVQLMKPGSAFLFRIPSDLAYGDQGTPGIPPKSTLIFKIELIAVE